MKNWCSQLLKRAAWVWHRHLRLSLMCASSALLRHTHLNMCHTTTAQRCDLPVSFPGGFITAIVVNPPEKRLAKRTSVHCSGESCTLSSLKFECKNSNIQYCLPQAPADLAFENFTIWILVYSTAHFLMYIKPQRSLFHPFKLNPNYPPNSLILKEILRSARGVGICTFYTVIVNKLYSSGMLPTKFVPSLFNHDGDVSWIQSFKSRPCENSLSDFHTSVNLSICFFGVIKE